MDFQFNKELLYSTIGILGIAAFKDQFGNLIEGLKVVWGKRFKPGDIVEIQSPSGLWEKVEIVSYSALFLVLSLCLRLLGVKKSAGVEVKHKGDKIENISFKIWKGLRIRKVPKDKIDEC